MKKIYNYLVRVISDSPCMPELLYLGSDFKFEAAAMEPNGAYQFLTNSMKTALTAMTCLRQLKTISCIEVLRNVPDLEDPEGNWELIAEYSSKGYKKACTVIAKARAEAKKEEIDESIKKLEELKAKLQESWKEEKKVNRKKNQKKNNG